MENRLYRQLHNDLSRVRRFIREQDLVSLGPEDRRDLEQAAAGLEDRLQAAEDQLLCAGFLGGTGVGKSSLMNALAGAEVAGTSHRRPHTHQVLVYRHVQAQLPPFVEQSPAPWREYVHQADAVASMLLCDLPDFDSLRTENREAVLQFMSHLDLVVWVASPEKYADRSLHEVLGQASKAAGNFYFVLNKVDRLWDRARAEESLEQMQRMGEHFRSQVAATLARKNAGTTGESPLLFMVSAVEEPPYSVWNQLGMFRESLFTRRSAKQTAAIKAANLEQEMRGMCQPLHAERAALEQGAALIRRLRTEVDNEAAAWDRDGANILESWVHNRLEPVLAQQGPGLKPLFGPARMVGAALREWRRQGECRQDGSLQVDQEEELRRLYPRIENLGNKLLTTVLRTEQAENVRPVVDEILNADRMWDRVNSGWQGVIHNALSRRRPIRGLGLTFSQGAVYGVLTMCLLLGLGGRQAWLRLFEQPGPGAGLEVLFGILESLFSPMGLAALFSFALLMLGAGIRFYRSHEQRRKDWARIRGEQVCAELCRVWNDELEETNRRLEEAQSSLDDKLQALETILNSGR
jgi:GTP-binding protein EngB required for normal cell division